MLLRCVFCSCVFGQCLDVRRDFEDGGRVDEEEEGLRQSEIESGISLGERARAMQVTVGLQIIGAQM